MKKVTAHLILFALLLLLTSQVAHAEDDREIMRLGRGQATSLDWRPDGKVLAVGSATGVWLLDENLNILSNPSSVKINDLSWSSTGDRIAIVGRNTTTDSCNTEIWDSSFRQVAAKLSICGNRLVWSPNTDHLAILEKEQSSIHVIDVNKDTEILTLVGDDFIWSLDSKEIITARYTSSSNQTSEIITYEIISGKATKYEREIYPSMPLLGITINHTLLTLCSEITDDRLNINLCHLDIETGESTNLQELLSAYIGDPGYWINSLKLNQDQQRYAYIIQSTTRGFLNNFILGNLKTNSGENIGNSEIFDWKPSSDIITSLVGNGLIRNINTTNQSLIDEEMLFTSEINSLAWKTDGKQIASTGFGYEQYARVWNINQTHAKPDLILYNEPAEFVSYTPHTNELITGGTIYTDIIVNQDISSWNADNGTFSRAIDGFYSQFESLPLTAWNSDYTHSAQNDLVDNVVKIDNGVIIKADSNQLKNIFWNPDDSMIATLSSNDDEMSETLEIWRVKDGKRISEYKTYGTTITNLSWSPNSQAFAVAFSTAGMNGMSNSVHVFQVRDENQSQVIDLSDVPEDLTALQWSHDNQKLLVATYKTISLYKASDLAKITSVKIPPTRTVSLSPDDKLIALGMDDGTIRIWDVSDLMAN